VTGSAAIGRKGPGCSLIPDVANSNGYNQQMA